MTQAEKQLLESLRSNVDSFDEYYEEQSADAPMISQRPTQKPNTTGASLTKMKGNPVFSAQFDLSLTLQFYTLNGGVYTKIAASALSGSLKTQLPIFLFGWNDFKAGFPKNRAAFPVNVWSYGRPQIFGRDSFSELALDANVTANLQLGDLVIPFTSSLPGTGTTTLALGVIHCTQVAYATLLESLVSDRFVMNMIRYVVPDETSTSLAQFAQNIFVSKLSLFGAFKSDFISPNSFKKGELFQKAIIDVPLKQGIDKQKSISTYINTNVTDIGALQWSIFVWVTNKHEA